MGRVRIVKRTLAVIAAFVTITAIAPHAEAFDRERVMAQIKRAWGGNDAKAIRVADCESGLNPKATSPHGTYLGLWQFSVSTWHAYDGPGDDPREVSAFRQTEVAYRLFQDRRWAPWPTCGSS